MKTKHIPVSLARNQLLYRYWGPQGAPSSALQGGWPLFIPVAPPGTAHGSLVPLSRVTSLHLCRINNHSPTLATRGRVQSEGACPMRACVPDPSVGLVLLIRSRCRSQSLSGNYSVFLLKPEVVDVVTLHAPGPVLAYIPIAQDYILNAG